MVRLGSLLWVFLFDVRTLKTVRIFNISLFFLSFVSFPQLILLFFTFTPLLESSVYILFIFSFSCFLFLMFHSCPLHLLAIIYIYIYIHIYIYLSHTLSDLYFLFCGTRWRSWLRHCATSWKVAGSIPDGVIGIFHWHNPSGHTMALRLTQPLT